MRINIVCVDNGVGLSRDMSLMCRLLRHLGHTVETYSPKEALPPPADMNIFLEIVNPAMLGISKIDAVVPNAEWWNQAWTHALGGCHILAKTRDCGKLFGGIRNRGVTYVGFTSEDRCLPEVSRYREFLHVAGRSLTKGTDLVITAWEAAPDLPRLTIIQDPGNARALPPKTKNIRYIADRLTDADLRHLQNQCAFHVCASQYEGFGHYIDEARSCGAYIFTTNAPPMHEFITGPFGDLISSTFYRPMGLARTWNIIPNSLVAAARRVLRKSDADLHRSAMLSRSAFLSNREAFVARFSTWLSAMERRLLEVSHT